MMEFMTAFLFSREACIVMPTARGGAGFREAEFGQAGWGNPEADKRHAAGDLRWRTRTGVQGRGEAGAPDRIRTCDLCLRRAALYPAELRVQ